jgi:hypothetical protein
MEDRDYNYEDNEIDMHEVKDYIEEIGGFNALSTNMQQALISSLDCLTEEEKTTLCLFWGIPLPKNIRMHHYLEQNFTIEQINSILSKVVKPIRTDSDKFF